MKRVFFSLLTLSLMLFGVAMQANAESCITFTNFCDGMQIDVDNGNAFGVWVNYDCLGNDTPALGRRQPNTYLSGQFEPSTAYSFVFNKKTSTFNLFSTDGETTSQIQFNQPFTSAPGPCSFANSIAGPTRPPSVRKLNR